MATHVYVAERKSGFNFTVVYMDAEGQEVRYRVRFEKSQFKTDDDKLAEEIDKLIAKVIPIKRNVRKADRAAAERLALEHKEMMQNYGAQKGGVTAQAAKLAMDTTVLQQRDERLKSESIDREAFADENLVLSETANAQPQVADEGGDPEPIPAPEKPSGIKLGGMK